MWTQLPQKKGHTHPTQFLVHVYCDQTAGWIMNQDATWYGGKPRPMGRCYTPFTRYNRLSNQLYNRFDNRLYRVNKHPTSCQTGCQPGLCNRFDNRIDNRFDNGLYTRDRRLSNRLYNRLNVCIHDTSGCQSGLTTGCIV